jgi:tRNA-2-methylthio-N6-dimethylallyladenosine synthase
LNEVPSLKEFIQSKNPTHFEERLQVEEDVSQMPEYLHIQREENRNKKYFIETHGCQMNVSDTEIVETILEGAGFEKTENMMGADVVLVNTCAIREGAEKKVWNKIESQYSAIKKKKKDTIVGVLGCMAERLKEQVLEHKLVDLVAGPDAY